MHQTMMHWVDVTRTPYTAQCSSRFSVAIQMLVKRADGVGAWEQFHA